MKYKHLAPKLTFKQTNLMVLQQNYQSNVENDMLMSGKVQVLCLQCNGDVMSQGQ